MAKSLSITREMEARLAAALGVDSYDFSQIAVFETLLADSRPLHKRGSIYDKARISPGTLQSMAAHLAQPGNAIPLHTLHRQHDELPIGRVFHAELRSGGDGEQELWGQFFLPRSRADLIADIDTGVIDSVSVGVAGEKLLCSECGFDFFGPESSIMNILEQTDNEGHVMGDNGFHARVVGLDKWYETSLVSAGAVGRAKIAARARSQLDNTNDKRLAAGITSQAAALFATFKEPENMTANTNGGTGGFAASAAPALEGLFAAHAQTFAELALAKRDLDAATAERDALKNKLTQLEARITELEAATDTDMQARLEASEQANADAKAKLDSFADFVAEQCESALVASGVTNPELPEGIEAQLAAIKEAGLKLHQLIPAGGKSQTIDATTSTVEEDTRSWAGFTSRK